MAPAEAPGLCVERQVDADDVRALEERLERRRAGDSGLLGAVLAELPRVGGDLELETSGPLRDFVGVDLLTDDSGESPREVPLIVRAKREADALAKTLHRLATGSAR